MTVAQPSLPDFLDTYPDKVRRYKDLLAAQDPEHTPYKSSYEAAQLQSDLAQQCQQATAGSTNADAPTTVIPNTDVHAPTLLGRIGVRRGIALAGTDLRQDALEALQRGMKHLRQQQPCEDLLSLINALNALGALHCALDQLRDGAEQLRAAEAAFHASQGDAAALRGSQQLLQLEGERGEGAARVLEDAHTTTVHYLAQVYQNMGEAAQAAEYCALTLQRQSEALVQRKEAQEMTHKDWASNASKLAVVFSGEGQYAEATQLLNAAECMLGMAADATGPERDLDAQLAADIAWHRGRVLLARLDASVDAREGCGSHTAPAPQGAQALPAHLRFPALALPPEHELPFGAAALAKSFEQARKLFNACAPQLRRALEYYQLDGWVTDHIQILFNLSKAYSDLAMFETDAHRACVMHHQRVKTFAGVSGRQLNYQHFEGLVKSVALEVASATRQISSIKEQHGWPAPKVASANAEAAAKQQAFIDMFKADGKLPDALPEEWREHVVAACISCARLHVHATGQRERLQAAEALLRYATGYIKQHKLEALDEQGSLAAQMHELVVQKLQMLQAGRSSTGTFGRKRA